MLSCDKGETKLKQGDIDKLIANKVLGYEVKDNNIVREGRRSGIPSYSVKIEYAWQIVKKLDYDVKVVFAETAPMAICKAALIAIEAKNKS